MKRIIITIALALGLICPLAAGSQAFAVDVFNNCGQGHVGNAPDVCQDAKSQQGNTDANGKPLDDNPIINIISTAITILSYLIGAAAIITIVVSGVRFMTSGGDSNAVASARSALVYALVGIAVAVLAQLFVAYVLNKIQ